MTDGGAPGGRAHGPESVDGEVGGGGGLDGDADGGGAGDGEAVVVRVDRGRCVGTGLCAAGAPADLVLGADGRARPVHPAGRAGAPGPELTEAAEMCPVEALTVHRAADGRQIAPVG